MATNGAGNYPPVLKAELPTLLDSDRIKGLLSKALVTPEDLTAGEIREIAASAAYHLLSKVKS